MGDHRRGRLLRQHPVFGRAKMSKSHRHTPVTGMTAAETDAPYKAREHRRARRAEKQAIAAGLEPPAPRAFGDPWRSEKDGKQWFDLRRHANLMRK